MKYIFILLILSACSGELKNPEKVEKFEFPEKPVIEIIPALVLSDVIGDDVEMITEPKGDNDELLKKIDQLVLDMKDIQEKSVSKIEHKKQIPISEVLKDKSIKHTGHYGGGTNCRGKIYRKEYYESWLYFHVDCNGNYTEQQVRRR
jgi:hypothetical protein